MSGCFYVAFAPILHVSNSGCGQQRPHRPERAYNMGEEWMKRATIKSCLMAGVATFSLIPASALAQTAKEKQLEARIEALERAFGTMQSELDSTKAENVQLKDAVNRAEARTTELASTVKAAPPAPVPAPALASAEPQDGFTVGNGKTRVKIGGFLKTTATFSRWDDGDVAGNSLGRDFYLPQAIPIGGTKESTDNDFNAKQTRLWLNLETQIAGHSVKGYVETDFQTAAGTQGTERTTNGYNLALRRAFIQFDNLTVGQDWSTFQYVGALPESTDFVGTTEGTVFSRQPLVRYSIPFNGKATTLHVSAENAETASSTNANPVLVENDDDSMPDFAARLQHNATFGELSLAGLVRRLSVDDGTLSDSTMAYGASLGGKIYLDADKRYDVRFMATYGSGIGRYVGLNFAPDAIWVPATGKLHKVDNLAAFGAVRLGWTPTLRSNLMASYQKAMYPDGFAPGYFNNFNKEAWSVAGNLFWSPVTNIDLGVEYRHGERILVNGLSGQLNRLEFAAKYSF